MADFVPTNDSEFEDWLARLAARLVEYREQFQMTEEEVEALVGDSDAFSSALSDYQLQRNALKSALGRKDTAKKQAIERLRPLVRRASVHPTMTDGIRGAMGLRIPDRTHHRHTVGSDYPHIHLRAVEGAVFVHFGTDPNNELLNGKPDWAKGCNIYRRKTGESEFSLVAFETVSPYVDRISGPPAEYTYFVQYRGNRAFHLGQPSAPTSVAASGPQIAGVTKKAA